MGKYEQVSVSLPTKLREKIEAYADENDIAKSRVIQQALAEFFEAPSADEDSDEDLDLWEKRIEREMSEVKSTLNKVLSKISLKHEIRRGRETFEGKETLEDEEPEETDEDDPWSWLDEE